MQTLLRVVSVGEGHDEANAAYPHLLEHLRGDDEKTFVTGPMGFWPADEFFWMVPVTKLMVDHEELI